MRRLEWGGYRRRKKSSARRKIRFAFRRRHHRRSKNTGPGIEIEEAQKSPGVLELERLASQLPKPTTRTGELILKKGDARKAMFVEAPPTLSLESHRDEFLGLIYNYRWMHWVQPARERGPYKTLVLDLAPVDHLALDAALVTTAEYHRGLLVHKNHQPIIDDVKWQPEVRALFDELGLLTLVKASARTGGPVGPSENQVRFVPFISGQRVQQSQARLLIDQLGSIAGQTPERSYIYNALVEAIKNVKHHAYPAGGGIDIMPSVSRWWAAGAYDPENDLLQFVVYDQGVGIPATLPKQSFWNSILRFCPPERSDADVIAGGIRYGRSRFMSMVKAEGATGQPEPTSHRGNGLWAICHFIPQLEGSYVRIHSGRGEVVFSGRKNVVRKLHDSPFCGTLIQWNLKLPPLAEEDRAA